eukprot:gnl/TRDRNA2_/TRDRNA2_57946_c0_seq1.p1 gnl/TRDRNA2_/TRDRNA2_57946_c0~~gnl/TRDRNA2_/TRDRNA2_57946_c0_seq1.p1  ORF type:complete len:128 (-),score=17.27 gnl/TRDRNA2_/TRDRNA2_57946_c0_seq1:8-391(-)
MGCCGTSAAGASSSAGPSKASKPIIIDNKTQKHKETDSIDSGSFVISDAHHPNGKREVPKLTTTENSNLHQRRSRSKESAASGQSTKESNDSKQEDTVQLKSLEVLVPVADESKQMGERVEIAGSAS